MPDPAKKPGFGANRDPGAPAVEKKPPAITAAGSVRGFDKIHGHTQPCASGEVVSVTVHMTRDTDNAAYKKMIAAALGRPDKTIRFAGGSIRVIVLPDGGALANNTTPQTSPAEPKTDAAS